jgi:hypothetical protein
MKAMDEHAPGEIVAGLAKHYDEIKAGIGVHKSPALYGAFPTDPYSHTPAHRGAQQPGMTGQVKEDVLVRRNELGVIVNSGTLHFKPQLLKKEEFLANAQQVPYIDLYGNTGQLELTEHSLFFSCCQVPVVYTLSSQPRLSIEYSNGSVIEKEDASLDEAESRKLFSRNGEVKCIRVSVNHLK